MNELYHHGILGQKWGVKNGPPYPLSGGKVSAVRKKRKSGIGVTYNKKHKDSLIQTKDTLSTLSYDKKRTSGTDMFYATYKSGDKHYYNAFFNKPADQEILDSHGNKIGTGRFLKYRIDNKVLQSIKVASEDSGSKAFQKLYERDRDFFNFVTDPNRMQQAFVKDKYKFRGYRESAQSLKKYRDGKEITESDVTRMYRMFNYTIPYSSSNSRLSNDVRRQRAKFFKSLKDSGYGAVLDTNDALYGGFKTKAPVIVFDMQSIALKDVRRTTISEKRASKLISIGRKIFNG